jgi:hypothetical protein
MLLTKLCIGGMTHARWDEEDDSEIPIFGKETPKGRGNG